MGNIAFIEFKFNKYNCVYLSWRGIRIDKSSNSKCIVLVVM